MSFNGSTSKGRHALNALVSNRLHPIGQAAQAFVDTVKQMYFITKDLFL